MHPKTLMRLSLLFAVAGVLFSGYLSLTKLLLGVCPLKESCPFLWGYPVCVYGFIMFFIAMVASIVLILRKDRFVFEILRSISAIGVFFSLYYVYQELFIIKCPGGCVYSLGVPTCIYGFVMFLSVHLFATFYGKKVFRKIHSR